jgi:Holliday junction resolvase RusA-like endonuclease
VALYWPTRANHDVDNIKTLLDSCSGIVWEDDGQIADLHITKAYDKENPRCELSVLPA